MPGSLNEQPIPIAAGEWLTTRFEFLDLMDRGKVKVVQPDMGRVGGLTEAVVSVNWRRSGGSRWCLTSGRPGSRSRQQHTWRSPLLIVPSSSFFLAELSESSLRKDLADTRAPHDQRQDPSADSPRAWELSSIAKPWADLRKLPGGLRNSQPEEYFGEDSASGRY